MRGAAQSGFSNAHVANELSDLTWRPRPTTCGRDFQAQIARKPARCQRITVSGLTIFSASSN